MTVFAQVRFKYLLGEFHLASWRPRFQLPESPPAGLRGRHGADAIHTEDLDPNADGFWCQRGAIDSFPLGISQAGQWLCYAPRSEKLHYVDLAGDFEAYLGRWSSKSRYNLKRSVRALLERNPQGVLDIASTPDAMEGFLREAAAISETTYQSRLLQSGLKYEENFLKRMREQAAAGNARGYLLRDQGRAIAFAWCSGGGARLTYDVIGYCEDAAAASPGSVLLYLIIEDLFRLGRFQVFDFGVGDAPYKHMFATHVDEFLDAYLFPPTFRNRILVHSHWRLDRASSAVGAFLERIGLKTKVRRLLRRLAATGA
jgi:CelD/BcsL family acetyltransferase involved in cellulose biosynthesis